MGSEDDLGTILVDLRILEGLHDFWRTRRGCRLLSSSSMTRVLPFSMMSRSGPASEKNFCVPKTVTEVELSGDFAFVGEPWHEKVPFHAVNAGAFSYEVEAGIQIPFSSRLQCW